MTLGEIVKNYRETHDLSQRQFAVACGLSNGYISMLEKNVNPKTGLPMAPSLLAMKKIADVMHISINELLEQIDEIPVTMSWEDEYRNRMLEYLQNTDAANLKSIEVDPSEIQKIVEGKRPLSLEDASSIADKFGLSIDHLIGRDAFHDTKEPAAIAGDGLSEKKLALIETLKGLDDADIDVVQAAADALIARREE